MKKYIVSITTTLLGLLPLYAQYTAVPDPNFEAYLEDNGMGDGIPGNGQVLTANIENVTELYAPTGGGIADLTGIEDFAALEQFAIALNPITEIDLSNNSNLVYVGIRATDISSFNLSNNNLEELVCYQNWGLNSVTVSGSNVKYLDLFENGLTQVDVTNCPALERLDFYYNYVQFIDVTNNPNLINLRVGTNPLQSLDVTNNPLLETLSVGHSNIPSLDLSQNTQLRMFSVAHDSNIAYIDVRNGNNENFEFFAANPNSSLKCVYVDDASAPYLEDWSIPNHAYFVNNEQECEAISVEEYQKPLFSMYPNPAKEQITVITESMGSYTLYTLEGKQVRQGKLMLGFNNLVLSGLPAGIYLIEVKTEKGIESKRIIKR